MVRGYQGHYPYARWKSVSAFLGVITSVDVGNRSAAMLYNRSSDRRTPQLVLLPNDGVAYTGSMTLTGEAAERTP